MLSLVADHLLHLITVNICIGSLLLESFAVLEEEKNRKSIHYFSKIAVKAEISGLSSMFVYFLRLEIF